MKRSVGAFAAAGVLGMSGLLSLPAASAAPPDLPLPFSETDRAGGFCLNSVLSLCVTVRLGPVGGALFDGADSFCPMVPPNDNAFCEPIGDPPPQ